MLGTGNPSAIQLRDTDSPSSANKLLKLEVL